MPDASNHTWGGFSFSSPQQPASQHSRGGIPPMMAINFDSMLDCSLMGIQEGKLPALPTAEALMQVQTNTAITTSITTATVTATVSVPPVSDSRAAALSTASPQASQAPTPEPIPSAPSTPATATAASTSTTAPIPATAVSAGSIPVPASTKSLHTAANTRPPRRRITPILVAARPTSLTEDPLARAAQVCGGQANILSQMYPRYRAPASSQVVLSTPLQGGEGQGAAGQAGGGSPLDAAGSGYNLDASVSGFFSADSGSKLLGFDLNEPASSVTRSPSPGSATPSSADLAPTPPHRPAGSHAATAAASWEDPAVMLRVRPGRTRQRQQPETARSTVDDEPATAVSESGGGGRSPALRAGPRVTSVRGSMRTPRGGVATDCRSGNESSCCCQHHREGLPMRPHPNPKQRITAWFRPVPKQPPQRSAASTTVSPHTTTTAGRGNGLVPVGGRVVADASRSNMSCSSANSQGGRPRRRITPQITAPLDGSNSVFSNADSRAQYLKQREERLNTPRQGAQGEQGAQGAGEAGEQLLAAWGSRLTNQMKSSAKS